MTSHASLEASAAAAADEQAWAHVMPLGVLWAVFLALIVLTYVTVSATWFDLGSWNLLIAMGIATLKAALVALYFMHLRYDHPFNALVLCVALLFLTIFVSITLLDTLEYQGDIQRRQESTSRQP